MTKTIVSLKYKIHGKRPFRNIVKGILHDYLGWRIWGVKFIRVRKQKDADFTIQLIKPQEAPFELLNMSATDMEDKIIYINKNRWVHGSGRSKMSLPNYRKYLINHEVGHVLGFAHEKCGGKGEPAPIMLQQTLGTRGCLPNPYPLHIPRNTIKGYDQLAQRIKNQVEY